MHSRHQHPSEREPMDTRRMGQDSEPLRNTEPTRKRRARQASSSHGHDEDTSTPSKKSRKVEPSSPTIQTRSMTKGKGKEMPPPVPIPIASSSRSVVPMETRNALGLSLASPWQSTPSLPFRSRPTFTLDPQWTPGDPQFVHVIHPIRNLRFLHLPAYDRRPGRTLMYGLHYETVLTACMILAYNRPGYLTKSPDRNAAKVKAVNSYLLPGIYYYHVIGPDNGETNYSICHDFNRWRFPHDEVPSSWSRPVTDDQKVPSNWSEVSLTVKARDKRCLISGSSSLLSTAHVVPAVHDDWLQSNKMMYYLGEKTDILHQSLRNLFTVRYDLHIPGFDQALFAIVPKCGKFTVHFLQEDNETANLYHNIIFDHNNNVAYQALYARFAWALIKMASKSNPELFNAELGDGDSKTKQGGKGRKGGRKDDGQGGGGKDGQGKASRRNNKNKDDAKKDGRNDVGTSSKYQELDRFSLGHDSWLSDVLFKMAPGTESSVADDLHEIQQDIRTAEDDHPFLVDANVKPSKANYETIVWYPGQKVVERRKQEYLARNPHIRAVNNPLLRAGT